MTKITEKLFKTYGTPTGLPISASFRVFAVAQGGSRASKGDAVLADEEFNLDFVL
jgi:hypothetical protein